MELEPMFLYKHTRIQNEGKESENSYQKLKRSLLDRHTKTHGNLNKFFDGHGRLSQSTESEHM